MDLKAYKLYLIGNEVRQNTIKNYMNTLQQLNTFLRKNNYELDKESLILYKEHLKSFEYSPKRNYKTNTINQKIVSINNLFELDREKGPHFEVA